MEETIKEIVDQFFKEKKLDKVKETEEALLKQFGKNFVNKNVKQITITNPNPNSIEDIGPNSGKIPEETNSLIILFVNVPSL